MIDIETLDSRLRQTLRLMCWRRAEGELQALLETFWDEGDVYKEVRRIVDTFRDDVYSLIG